MKHQSKLNSYHLTSFLMSSAQLFGMSTRRNPQQIITNPNKKYQRVVVWHVMCFNISDKRCDATCKFHWVGAEVGMINYWVVSWNKSSFAGFPIIVRIIMITIILINDHPENHLDDHLDQLKTCWSWNSGDQAESDEVLVSDQDREVCQEVCRWNIKISYKWLQINNQH